MAVLVAMASCGLPRGNAMKKLAILLAVIAALVQSSIAQAQIGGSFSMMQPMRSANITQTTTTLCVLSQPPNTTDNTSALNDSGVDCLALQAGTWASACTAATTCSWTSLNTSLTLVQSKSKFATVEIATWRSPNAPAFVGTDGGVLIGGTNTSKLNYRPTDSVYLSDFRSMLTSLQNNFVAQGFTSLVKNLGMTSPVDETTILGCLSGTFTGASPSYTYDSSAYATAVQAQISAYMTTFSNKGLWLSPGSSNQQCPNVVENTWYQTNMLNYAVANAANGNVGWVWAADVGDPAQKGASGRIQSQITGGWVNCASTNCGGQFVGSYTTSTAQKGGNPFIGICWGILNNLKYFEFYLDDFKAARGISTFNAAALKALNAAHSPQDCNW